MAALPPTAAGSSDQLPDTHSPSRRVTSASAAAAAAPDLAAAKVAAGRADGGTFKGSCGPQRLGDDMRAISGGSDSDV